MISKGFSEHWQTGGVPPFDGALLLSHRRRRPADHPLAAGSALRWARPRLPQGLRDEQRGGSVSLRGVAPEVFDDDVDCLPQLRSRVTSVKLVEIRD